MVEAKHILVTGGAGYIGSHTVVELINSGFTPVVVDDFRNSRRQMIDGIEKITGRDVLVHEIDICDRKALKEVFLKYPFQGIIHFAAYKAVGESVEQPLMYYRNNLIGFMNCLELAIEHKVGNFVFSSSCTVYGEPDEVKCVSELSPQKPPSSPYGNTKKIGEEIINDTIQSGAPIKALNLRYFNPIGAHPSGEIGELPLGRPNNLLPIVTQTGIGKIDHLVVNGGDYNTVDGTCVRDYIHVSDVAEAHVRGLKWLMNQNEPHSESLNIGTGKGTSVLEIIHTFEEVSGRSLNWKMGSRRKGDVVEIYADVSKANRLLDWKTKRTVREAVKDAWNWEKKLHNE